MKLISLDSKTAVSARNDPHWQENFTQNRRSFANQSKLVIRKEEVSPCMAALQKIHECDMHSSFFHHFLLCIKNLIILKSVCIFNFFSKIKPF